MRVLLVFSILIVFLSSFIKPVRHQPGTAPSSKDTTPVYEMKQYWLALLYRGPNRIQDSLAAARIQKAHLNNIERLHPEGKIIMAGPMGYNKDLRGIFIMDAKDSSQAAGYINTDSAIITGAASL